MKPLRILPFLFCLLLTGCNWFRKDPAPELPPATQEGKRTFGCRVNGQVWLPSGKEKIPNLSATYDPYYSYGKLVILANKSKDGKIYQSINLFLDSLTQPGTYKLNTFGKRAASFGDYEKCLYDGDVTYMEGTVTLTRFNTYTRLVSGTFEFTLAKPDCDTIRVTDGRFDLIYGF